MRNKQTFNFGGLALLCLSLLTALILSGCSTILSKPDPLKIVVLHNYAPEAPQCGIPVPVQIMVPSPYSSAGLATDRIAILSDKREVNYLIGYRWDDEAATIVQRTLVDALNSSGCYRGAGTGSLALNASYRLEIDVKRLHFVYDHGEKRPFAEVRLLVSLVEIRTGDLLGQYSAFSRQQTSEDDLFSPMEYALQSAIQQTQDWLYPLIEDSWTRLIASTLQAAPR